MTLPLQKHRHTFTSNTAAAVNDTPFFFFGQYNVCRHLTNYLFYKCFGRRWRKGQKESQQDFAPVTVVSPQPVEDNSKKMNRNSATPSAGGNNDYDKRQPGSSKTVKKHQHPDPHLQQEDSPRLSGDKKKMNRNLATPSSGGNDDYDQHQPGSSRTVKKHQHPDPRQQQEDSPQLSGDKKKARLSSSLPAEEEENVLTTQQFQYKRPGARIHISGPVELPNQFIPAGAPTLLQAALHTVPTHNPNTAVAFTIATTATVGTNNTTGTQGIRQHIETSTKTGVFHLSKVKLVEFPAELEKIATALRSIDLSENKINQIPENISSFVNLKHLNLSHNQIEVVPDQLGELSKLESLSLANNQIKSVPATISQLQKLRDANFNSNQMNAFPIAFSNLKFLTVLDLGNNRISQVPDGVGGLQVVELILNRNQVRKVSKDLARCPNLKTLRLQGNRLEVSGFPKELLSESPVSLLSLEGNLFDVKQLRDVEGFEQYMERYTQTKKKLS